MKGCRDPGAMAVLIAGLLAVASPAGAAVQMQIVAHQDDDLYFMNPAVRRGIAAGDTSWTVYVTAGDAGLDQPPRSTTQCGGLTYHWECREQGMRAAYARMAGVANAWTDLPVEAGGRAHSAIRLAAAPRVVLLFLRLPDGSPGGGGYAVTGMESLARLWDGSIAAIRSVEDDPAQREIYTRGQLIDVLTDLIELVDPDVLRLQDMTFQYGSDHSDHFHAGRFGLEAHHRAAGTRRLRAYRAYNTEDEPVNLSSGEIGEASDPLLTYEAYDNGVLPNAWTSREIALGDLHLSQGHVTFDRTLCLEVGGSGARGSPVTFASCAAGERQRFEVTSRDLRHGSLCVTAVSLAPGASLELQPCDGSLAQSWAWLTDQHARGPDGLCLGALGADPRVVDCGDTIRPWELRSAPAIDAAPGTQFSGFELGADPARYRSLSLGDLDGDGLADACARRADGVYCALALGGGLFGTATRWHDDFDDARGWGLERHGSTVQLGDVTGDGRADVCGRGGAGVYCARSTGSAFADFGLWTTSFGDAEGGTAPEVYASVRLGDVTGDGRADVCGHRGGAGIDCAVSTGSAFGPASEWITQNWYAALGLPAAQVGRTLMLGDISGDGRADLCERGTDGVHCALARAGVSGFHDAAMRSQGEFSDARGWSNLEAYWRSLRLGDITGDGQADLCGRGGRGLLCLMSIDGRFSALDHDVGPDFSDDLGFDATERGTTLRLADVDGDGGADACAAGATRLRCALLPASCVPGVAGSGDRDCDGIADAADVCPDWAQSSDADSDGDGRGDACTCGDQSGDGRLTVVDILAINAAIFDVSQVTALCDANHDGRCDVGDILAVNAAIFGAPTFCARSPRP